VPVAPCPVAEGHAATAPHPEHSPGVLPAGPRLPRAAAAHAILEPPPNSHGKWLCRLKGSSTKAQTLCANWVCSPGRHSETCESFTRCPTARRIRRPPLCRAPPRFFQETPALRGSCPGTGTLSAQDTWPPVRRNQSCPRGVRRTPQSHVPAFGGSLQSSGRRGDAQPAGLPNPVFSPSKRHRGVGSKPWGHHSSSSTARAGLMPNGIVGRGRAQGALRARTERTAHPLSGGQGQAPPADTGAPAPRHATAHHPTHPTPTAEDHQNSGTGRLTPQPPPRPSAPSQYPSSARTRRHRTRPPFRPPLNPWEQRYPRKEVNYSLKNKVPRSPLPPVRICHLLASSIRLLATAGEGK